MSTPIHQEIALEATPQRVYEALTRAEQFSAVTGGESATIDAKDGGAFALFGGKITGRNIELIENQRIVQAWRAGNWAPGVYSIVHFEISAEGKGARLVMDHAGFPADHSEHLAPGWHKMYWAPLAAYLASSSAA